MKVLVIGSGGREHAMAWKIKQSPKVSQVIVAPGNPGINKIAQTKAIKADDLEGLLAFAIEEAIDLTVVGPEVPLVKGIVNLFEAQGLRIFGPKRFAAQFEGSKAFSKAFMAKHKIPTAAYKAFDTLEAAQAAVTSFGFPLVIKADGLAAGKGVVISENEADARQVLQEMMGDSKFGAAGTRVVFEEFMTGVEASMLCFVDGKTIVPMASAQDYKKAYDGDKGLNTGGMGAYSPSAVMDEALEAYVKTHVLDNFIRGIEEEGIDYRGILFIGLMLEGDKARVVEFNCRMGDPETQVVLPRMENDLVDLMEACINQTLDQVELTWKPQACVGLVLASGGYPEAYDKGRVISGLDSLDKALVFHAGTSTLGGDLVTAGGRVLNLVALAPTIDLARQEVYHMVAGVHFDQMMYRKDIAKF